MNYLKTSTSTNKIKSIGMIEIYVRNARVLNDTCISENMKTESVFITFLKCVLVEQQLYAGIIEFI